MSIHWKRFHYKWNEAPVEFAAWYRVLLFTLLKREPCVTASLLPSRFELYAKHHIWDVEFIFVYQLYCCVPAVLCNPLVKIVWCVIVRKERTNICRFPPVSHGSCTVIGPHFNPKKYSCNKRKIIFKSSVCLCLVTLWPALKQGQHITVMLRYLNVIAVYFFIWEENMKN